MVLMILYPTGHDSDLWLVNVNDSLRIAQLEADPTTLSCKMHPIDCASLSLIQELSSIIMMYDSDKSLCFY